MRTHYYVLSFQMQADSYAFFVIETCKTKYRYNTRALAKTLSDISKNKGKTVRQQECICHLETWKHFQFPVQSYHKQLKHTLQTPSWLAVSENVKGSICNLFLDTSNQITMLGKLILSHQID